MDRYSKIQSTLWDSKKFNKLNDFEKVVYLYLLSCPHGNSAGIFKLKRDYAISDLRCSAQRYQKAMESLCKELISIDGEIVLIHDYIRFNPYTNKKHSTGAVKFVSEHISSPLYAMFYRDLQAYNANYIDVFPKPTESLPIAYEKPIPDEIKAIPTDTNTNTNSDTDTDSKHKHGDYKKVLLTDDEYQKLTEKFGDNERGERIQRLDDYIASTGKAYKSHYHTILNWAKKDEKQNTPKKAFNGERKYTENEIEKMVFGGDQ